MNVSQVAFLRASSQTAHRLTMLVPLILKDQRHFYDQYQAPLRSTWLNALILTAAALDFARR